MDEIGEMPLEVQAVLLRVLQTQEVVRIGGKYPIPVNVRVIAATHRDLAIAVQEQTFRNDLYYRLNVLSINLPPPLRERKDDILKLVEFFLKKFQHQFEKPNLTIDDMVCKLFEVYDWPGNIRELENVLQRAAVICENDLITIHDIPSPIVNYQPNDFSQNQTQQDGFSLEEGKREKLIQILQKTNGNVREVSALLRISRGTVYNMLNRYHIDLNAFRKGYTNS